MKPSQDFRGPVLGAHFVVSGLNPTANGHTILSLSLWKFDDMEGDESVVETVYSSHLTTCRWFLDVHSPWAQSLLPSHVA